MMQNRYLQNSIVSARNNIDMHNWIKVQVLFVEYGYVKNRIDKMICLSIRLLETLWDYCGNLSVFMLFAFKGILYSFVPF